MRIGRSSDLDGTLRKLELLGLPIFLFQYQTHRQYLHMRVHIGILLLFFPTPLSRKQSKISGRIRPFRAICRAFAAF